MPVVWVVLYFAAGLLVAGALNVYRLRNPADNEVDEGLAKFLVVVSVFLWPIMLFVLGIMLLGSFIFAFVDFASRRWR